MGVFADRQGDAAGGEAPGDAVPVPAQAAEISRLFHEHNRALVSYLSSCLNDEQAAWEVAQEAYVRLLQLERPGAIGFLRAYLFRVARNLAIDRLRQDRSRVRREELDGAELFEEPLAERALIAREECELIRQAVAELPPKYQQAFRGHRVQERAFEDIAAEMGLKPRMVRHYVTLSLVYIKLRRQGLGKDAAWKQLHAAGGPA